MITSTDLRREIRNIVQFCANECERQQSGELSVADMINAYQFTLWLFEQDVPLTESNLIDIGYAVDPIKNANGFRTTPVTFADGGSATKHYHIDRQLQLLLNEQKSLHPKEWIKRFLEIHPFADGNGRAAAILYNFLMRDLHAPQPLPKFEFV